MIAKTTSAPRFAPLAAYLATGTDGRHPNRVEWAAARHLADNDLTAAAAIMEATAYQSARVERPCYHIVISFDESDRPTRGQIEQVADRVVSRLGLSDHQALLVAHNDRLFEHVHMMINRVHPETGVAWERWKDRHVIEAALRDAERDLGFREVPGRLAAARDHERYVPVARQPDLTWGERRLATRTARMPLLERARTALTACREARSWHELASTLDACGLSIARTSKGIVITDGRTRVNASRVAPDLGLPRLEARFGDRYQESSASNSVERIVALIGTLEIAESLERDAHDTNAARQRAAGALTVTQAGARRAQLLSEQLTAALGHVYRNPTATRRAFDALERNHGITHACTVLARQPQTLGVLRPVATTGALRHRGARDGGNTQSSPRWIAQVARDAAQARDEYSEGESEVVVRDRVELCARRATAARDALEAHRVSVGDARAIRQAVARAIAQLLPSDRAVLETTLTPTQVVRAHAIVRQPQIDISRDQSRGW